MNSKSVKLNVELKKFVGFLTLCIIVGYCRTFLWNWSAMPRDHLGRIEVGHRQSDWRWKRINNSLAILNPIVAGYGDNGNDVRLVAAKDIMQANREFPLAYFNKFVSDRIAPNRSLQFVGNKSCLSKRYSLDELPTLSVIIIFTDEIFSALIRTIWSVINRTPGKLLKEIILVDDFSATEPIKRFLPDYIDYHLNILERNTRFIGESTHRKKHELVKLIRLKKREGVIKARLAGAKMATGDVMMFLDAHCEVTPHWAEPLLQRIKNDRKVFIIPVVDVIDAQTLGYRTSKPPFEVFLGGFNWRGIFDWLWYTYNGTLSEPIKTPTMPGGLYAVDRQSFWEMGSYDDGMSYWGAENLEMSFRVWQCGGRVEIHPCSHVGHISRKMHPYSLDREGSNAHNLVRTARVWLDEYQRYFYLYRPYLAHIKTTSLESRHELRNRLKCKSFDWYLKEVYEGKKFIFDKNVKAYGRLSNEATDLCFDDLSRPQLESSRAGLKRCYPKEYISDYYHGQILSLTSKNRLQREESCLRPNVDTHTGRREQLVEAPPNLVAVKKKKKKFVYMERCIHFFAKGDFFTTHLANYEKALQWKYETIEEGSKHHLIRNVLKDNDCWTTEFANNSSNKENFDLGMTDCDRDDVRQHWVFDYHSDEYYN